MVETLLRRGNYLQSQWQESRVKTLFKRVSMRKPDRTWQKVVQLKSPISLKLGTNIGIGK